MKRVLGMQVVKEEMVWAVEQSNLCGDDILVDDIDYLLDLGELTEPEKEVEVEEKEKEAEAESPEMENSNSYFSSLSFELDPLTLHAVDEAELEWVSRMVDGSFSEFPPCSGVPPYHPAPKTQTEPNFSPPYLNSATVCILSTEALLPVAVKAKRSKRSRIAAARVWSISSPPPFTDSSTTTSSSSSSCSSPSYSSFPIYDHTSAGMTTPILKVLPKKHKPKKRGRKPNLPPPASAIGGTAAGERRCSHCGVPKTPQWRAGPVGAKTLCNACGVRFKSGRLLPEYRPACSPTFVSHLHSNSHRKVLEMRRKNEGQLLSAAAPPVPSF